MKLTVVFIFITCLHVNAKTYSQKVTLDVRQTSLEKVFLSIKAQTGFGFFIDQELLRQAHPVTLKVKDVNLNEALDLCFQDQPLTYNIIGKTVVVKEKEVGFFEGHSTDVNETNLVFKEIKGKVVDKEGQPLEGVSVIKRGTKQGTFTNISGDFSIEANAKDVLVFTIIGYKSVSVTVGTGQSIRVTMEVELKAVDEIVVIGYGTQRKSDVTGSLSKISGSDIADNSSTSFDQQLAGRAAGVQVTVGSGNTNAAPRMRIRGINSINNSRGPLVVVDGVPFSTTGVGVSTSSNPLADINPDDIESIDILKDGAATAIYGSRAANGVILITTKRGVKNETRVNFNSYFSVSNPVKIPTLLNAKQFVEIANEKYLNSGVNENPARLDNSGTDVDWQSLVYNKNAFSQNHSLNISSGNEKTNYYFSLNYLDQHGVVIKNQSTRYSFRGNFNHQINKVITVGVNTMVANVNNEGFNTGSGLSSINSVALVLPPNVDPYDVGNPTGYNLSGDGKSLGAGPNLQTVDDAFANILFTINNDNYSVKTYRILSSAYGEIKPFPSLKFRSQVSADINMGYDFYSLDSRHGDGFSYNGLIRNTFTKRNLLNLQNYLTYSKSFHDHNLTIVAGNEIQKENLVSVVGAGSDFSNSFFQEKNLIENTYTKQISEGNYSESGFLSYFSRLNYDFSGRYILALSVRRDGLSSLSLKNRFGNFPGVSVGWFISNERFWSQSNIQKVITGLKLRASYGKVGNALTGFPYLSTYGAAPYGSLNGIGISSVGNPSLRWETSKKIDIGIDATLLDNRITFGFDWFKNDIDNLVMSVSYPNSYGIPGNSVSRNVGAMNNRGIELTLSSEVIQGKKLNWRINSNFTSFGNKVTQLFGGNNLESSSSAVRIGEPLNVMIGYLYGGVNTVTGNPLYYKADGRLIQGNINDQKYYYANSKQDDTFGEVTTLVDEDKVILGNPNPTWFGGIMNSFTYGQFSIDAFIRFSGGNKIDNGLRRSLLNQKFKNNGTEILDRWTPTNTHTDVPKLWYGKEAFINLSPSSRWIESGNYLKLQSLMISYTFKNEGIRRGTNSLLSGARLYLLGQNIFTVTRFKGIDPDMASETGGAGSGSPTLRSFTFGFNLSF